MRRRIFRLFSRSGRDRARELDEEIEAHLAMRIADLEGQGLSPREARAEALSRFGDLDAARRDLHAASFRRDLKLSLTERAEAPLVSHSPLPGRPRVARPGDHGGGQGAGPRYHRITGEGRTVLSAEVARLSSYVAAALAKNV